MATGTAACADEGQISLYTPSHLGGERSRGMKGRHRRIRKRGIKVTITIMSVSTFFHGGIW